MAWFFVVGCCLHAFFIIKALHFSNTRIALDAAVAPRLFGKFLYGDKNRSANFNGNSSRGSSFSRGGGRGPSVKVIGHVSGTGFSRGFDMGKGRGWTGEQQFPRDSSSNYTPLAPRFLRQGAGGEDGQSTSSKRSRVPDSAESSGRHARKKHRPDIGTEDSSSSESEELCSLKNRVRRLEGGLEDVTKQAEFLDRSLREKEFRIWNVPYSKNEELVDMFGLVLMNGLGYSQEKVEKFLSESLTLLRRPKLGNTKQGDSCILVGVNSLAAKEMIFGDKSKLNVYQNPWGGRAISITPNYTNKQSAISKECRAVLNQLVRNGHRVKMVGYDRLCVDGGEAKNFNYFTRGSDER